MNTRITESRRDFLKALAAGSAVVLCGPVALATVREEGAPGNATTDGERKKRYAFVVDVDKCIGCGNCVRACNEENQVPAGVNRTWVERYVMTADGVHIDSPAGGADGFPALDDELAAKAEHVAFIPKLCNHCDNAPCVQVCPVGATFTSPEGFVLVDPEHCMGCGYCIQACPYGARFMNKETHVADKCTWCYHRVSRGLLPACVTVCPTDARQFGDLEQPDSPAAQAFAGDRWKALKPYMHTDSMCFYLGLPREVV